eukprot:TRINITY_DN74331_c0_g1_i1.p1 TRINITY_DN74331_c0_g1~~TRINITY_DN74331_c0_g1_i1.p1  ORF type:complete len:124 (-),score=12.60 TRINITY_DN74331_c0_g1_i1:75-446(-)
MVLPLSVFQHCVQFFPLHDIKHALAVSRECRIASLKIAKTGLLNLWRSKEYPKAAYILKSLRTCDCSIKLGTEWLDLWKLAAVNSLKTLAKASLKMNMKTTLQMSFSGTGTGPRSQMYLLQFI